MTHRVFWIERSDGTRRRVGAAPVVVGRRADCGLVLDDPGISRRQVLFQRDGDGVLVALMGRGEVRIDGVLLSDTAHLSGDASFELGEQRLRLVCEQEHGKAPTARWALESAAGLMGLREGANRVGGGRDDLAVPGWPSGAATIWVTPHSVEVELTARGRVAGQEVGPGGAVVLQPGEHIEFSGTRLRLTPVMTGGEASTCLPGQPTLPDNVHLEFSARGGVLTLGFGSTTGGLYLAERRCALVAALLRPRHGGPGDYVETDELVSRVWPNRPGKGRTDVNVLVLRTRRDLVKAGLPGARLLVGAEGGLATAFAVAPGARVVVE